MDDYGTTDHIETDGTFPSYWYKYVPHIIIRSYYGHLTFSRGNSRTLLHPSIYSNEKFLGSVDLVGPITGDSLSLNPGQRRGSPIVPIARDEYDTSIEKLYIWRHLFKNFPMRGTPPQNHVRTVGKLVALIIPLCLN